jgi:hypothetical protein
MGSLVDPGRSTEGEGHVDTYSVDTYSCSRHHETLRNDALHSRRQRPSPTPDPLKVENARLREELREARGDQIHLCHDVEHLRLECDQLLEKLEFMKDKGGQRPYPHPSYSNKDAPRDTSSENSISAN